MNSLKRKVKLMTIKELYDYLPSTNKNIFSTINANILGGVWTNSGLVTSSDLNPINMNFWSSVLHKDVSVQVSNYFELAGVDIESMTSAQYNSFIAAMFTIYKDKWLKLFNNVFAQTYNPIWNVDGDESTVRTYEYGKKETNTKDFEIEHEHGTTDTETVTNNVTDNDVYGFNSSTPVGASKSTNNGSRTNVGSGSDTDVHSGTDDYQQSGVDTERITHTRGGNIGVTSTQNMLEQELALREKFNYFKIVTDDIIRVLTMNVYN